jgi:hypothetical protein
MLSDVRGRNRFSRWRGFLIALVLVIAFGNAGGMRLARAMPNSAGSVSVSYSVFAYPEKFEILNCPNAKQKIFAGVSKTVTKVINEKSYEMSGGTVNYVDIEAKMAEPKRGSVSPMAATIISMDRTGTFQTVFIYDPKEVGTDTITFSVTNPNNDELLVSLVAMADATVQVKVKPCQYKVNTLIDTQLSDEGVAWSGIGLIKDAIIEQGDDGVLRGSADLEWNVFNHATTDGGCVYQPHTAISQAEITGQPNEEVMTWTLTYQDAQESVTATCVDVGTQTFDNLQPLSEYGPSVVTISSSGGAARYSQAWAWPTGGESAKYTIIVEPEEEKSVSKTGDPLAWLPDWFEAALFLPGVNR